MGFDLQAHQELRRLSYQVNCLVRDFCCRAKRCFGISENGNPNLVLNQQGDWVIAGGGDIQTLLSDLPEYLGAKEASEDGKPLGYWYYNTFSNIVTKVTNFISSFTSGTSTIDFTNNGGDDWGIGFKITPTTPPQSTANIVGYQYAVNFWNSGVDTPLSGGFKTTDFTFNTAGNGAGIYEISQTYVFDDSSIFRIACLYKVNASGVVVAYVSANGVTVNSTNGLTINATAHYTEYGVSYTLFWASYDNYPPSYIHAMGSTTTINANAPLDSIGIGFFPILDSVFTNDYAGNTGSVASIVIS